MFFPVRITRTRGSIRGLCVATTGEVFISHDGHQILSYSPDSKLLAIWGKDGSKEGEFLFPGQMAINDHLFVCDELNHRVQVFTKTGTFIRSFGSIGSKNGEFIYPSGIGLSKSHVFVVDEGNNRVQVFTFEGEFVRTWGASESEEGYLDQPSTLAMDSNEVFVVDKNNHRVQVFSQEGKFLREWPNPKASLVPCYISIVNDMVHLSGYGLHIYDKQGRFIKSWEPGACVEMVAKGRNGAFYLAGEEYLLECDGKLAPSVFMTIEDIPPSIEASHYFTNNAQIFKTLLNKYLPGLGLVETYPGTLIISSHSDVLTTMHINLFRNSGAHAMKGEKSYVVELQPRCGDPFLLAKWKQHFQESSRNL